MINKPTRYCDNPGCNGRATPQQEIILDRDNNVKTIHFECEHGHKFHQNLSGEPMSCNCS